MAICDDGNGTLSDIDSDVDVDVEVDVDIES
jgi:hypothetical protein